MKLTARVIHVLKANKVGRMVILRDVRVDGKPPAAGGKPFAPHTTLRVHTERPIRLGHMLAAQVVKRRRGLRAVEMLTSLAAYLWWPGTQEVLPMNGAAGISHALPNDGEMNNGT
jgi:hypothetical protein